MQSFGADIKENADHGEQKHWVFQQPKARSDAGRHFRLGLLDLKHGHGHEA